MLNEDPFCTHYDDESKGLKQNIHFNKLFRMYIMLETN
jgi:hypothetical protein